MYRLIRLLVAASLASAAAHAAPEPPDQRDFIAQAVWGQGRLWLLDDAGNLSTLAEGGARRDRQALGRPVFGLCAFRGGDPVALMEDPRGKGDWTLTRRETAGWRPLAKVRGEGDPARDIECDANGIFVVSYRRLVELSPDGRILKTTRLSGAAGGRGRVTTAVRTADSVYVGIDAGEWGGGLRRIDRRTGVVTDVQRLDTDEGFCGGMLNSSCDPVNDLEPEPGKPGCVVASVGLVHFFASGRLLQVCGDKVELLYSRTIDKDENGRPRNKVAFFGLATVGDRLLATGIDGLYEVGPGGEVTHAELPHFHTVDGVAVSFDRPGVALVLTEINERVSVSGAVPTIVAR